MAERLLRRWWIAPVLLVLAACGGGGGGSTGTAVASQPAPTAPAPIGPSVTSPEYQLSWGLAGVKAEAAWSRGVGGQGVTVAVIDAGVDPAQADLVGRVSPASRDLNTVRNQPVGSDQHGTRVAGVIASNFNGMGTVGVAFNASILSLRADSASGSFNTNDLAAGIDAAVAGGARVINLSVGTTTGPAGAAFEAALQRAVNAGVVVAASAGNEGTDVAHWPSNYAADPRYAGAVLAVGSVNSAGGISAFSNRAGGAASGFLLAPGEGVVTNCSGAACVQVSGTSFAAPHASGALALVLQGFPNLSGRQAVDLLLRTARDLGAPGVDPVYGWGALDLQRAFAPVGTLSVPVDGAVVVANGAAGASMMGAAFGDAVQNSAALATVGWDAYQRPFGADLSLAYATARPSLLAPIPPGRSTSAVDLVLNGGAELRLAAGVETPDEAARPFGWMPVESPREVTVSFRSGRLGFAAWTGAAADNPFTSESPDPYAGLAQARQAVRADYRVGRWLVSAEGGAGERRSPDLLRREDGARYVRAAVRGSVGPVETVAAFGRLDEPMGPLGAYVPARSGLQLPSETRFAAVGFTWPLAGGFALDAQGGLGRTDLKGRFLALEEAAWSTAWRTSLIGPCAAFGLRCDGLRLSLSQPLRIEGGRFLARLPDAPTTYFGPVNISQRRFAASPSGRQMDLALTATTRAPLGGRLQLDAVVSTEVGHVAGAAPEGGFLATWKAGF